MKEIYLAGAIEQRSDSGMHWRVEACSLLAEKGIIGIWPPTLGKLTSDEVEQVLSNDDLFMGKVVRPDIRALLSSDAMLLNVCESAGYGTRAEVCISAWARIPIFWVLTSESVLLSPLNLKDLPRSLQCASMEDAALEIKAHYDAEEFSRILLGA